MTYGYDINVKKLYKVVSIKGKKKNILNDVNLNIEKGSFVTIVGCSGAGKTTLMKILSGYSKLTSGNIYINNIKVENVGKELKGKIGYVPQSEILDGNLSLYKSLYYSLKLRVKNVSNEQAEKIINNILNVLELTKVKENLIKTLSGGERKRASIATEMLSNPNLFLLDEPTSGLDANIEKKLMEKLREIANLGKTVVITAHTTSNLQLCDKIIFMGNEGKICYYGTYDEIFDYFNVKEFTDIYEILKNDTDSWHKKFCLTTPDEPENKGINQYVDKSFNQNKVSFFTQIKVLVGRFKTSLFNNKLMLILLLGQPVLMGGLVCLATSRNSLTDPLTATIVGGGAATMAAMWLGLFNTIQEVAKEKDILKKEYISGLNFSAYIISKIIVFSILCLYQSIICILIFYFYLEPRPETILITAPLIDLIINFFLVSFSTSVVGIFISSIVKEVKVTLIIAPLYMMVQMLFAEMFFPLNSLTRFISHFVIGRWGYEGFGTINNLNHFGIISWKRGHFDFTKSHIMNVWFIFFIMIIFFLILSIISIKKNILSENT